MTNYNEKYTKAYVSYKAVFEDLENWNAYNKLVKMVLLSQYLDTKEVKSHHDSKYLKGVKHLYEVVKESFNDLVKPSQYKQVLLGKLEECSKIDFTDKALSGYYIFVCQDLEKGATNIVDQYNLAIQKYNKAAKAIPNTGIEIMKSQYSILTKNIEIMLKAVSMESYKVCNIIVDLLSSNNTNTDLIKFLDKDILMNIDQCGVYKKLFESIEIQKNNQVEVAKCVNLNFDVPYDVFFGLSKCEAMKNVYDKQHSEISKLAEEYGEIKLESYNQAEDQSASSIFSHIPYVAIAIVQYLVINSLSSFVGNTHIHISDID